MKAIIKSIFNVKQQDNFSNIWGQIKTKEQSSRLWLENITTLKM